MAKVVEETVVEPDVVDVTEGTGVVVGGVSQPVDHSLLDVRIAGETRSDWVDPATVVDTVKLGYVEAAEGLLVSE